MVELRGGREVRGRLRAMGIIKGVKITKLSSLLLHGPVIILSRNSRLAIGYGLGQKIMVELDMSGQNCQS